MNPELSAYINAVAKVQYPTREGTLGTIRRELRDLLGYIGESLKQIPVGCGINAWHRTKKTVAKPHSQAIGYHGLA